MDTIDGNYWKNSVDFYVKQAVKYNTKVRCVGCGRRYKITSSNLTCNKCNGDRFEVVG